MIDLATIISITINITAIMMIIIMIIMMIMTIMIIIKAMTVMIIMIIIVIQSIYNEIKARSNKIPNIEKTGKSSVLQPFERNVEKKNFFAFKW